MFEFYKYINPLWYYNLIPIKSDVVSPLLSLDVVNKAIEFYTMLDKETRFDTAEADFLDSAFQLWHKGIFVSTNTEQKRFIDYKNISTVDNYIFVKKYFGYKWVYYILFRRIFSLNNPLQELRGFLFSLSTKTVNIYSNKIELTNFINYKPAFLINKPYVSVIIPTLNRYEYLKDVLLDLENQTFKNFEVIIVDQSEPFDKKFYDDFNLSVILIEQKEKALWKARNFAITKSKGDFLLFFDDDSRVEPDWIYQHLKCLEFYNADISAGVSISKVGDKVPLNYFHFRWADQFDSGNAMVKKNVFLKIGMFDRQFDGMRMGDSEFGLRAYLNGFISVSNPLAMRIHLKVSTGGLRQMGSWDAFRPKNLFSPKPVPSVVYLLKRYYPFKNSFEAILLGVFLSSTSYKLKGKRYSIVLSFFKTCLFFPLILFCVYKAFRIGSRMFKLGNKIEY